MGILQARIWSGLPCPPAGDFPNPGIEPRSPTLRADSLPTEPQGKPKNTGVGRLSLLQGIFPTQESNQGLLHCRWILYQLSYWRHPTNGTTLAWKDEYNFQKYLFIQEDFSPPLYYKLEDRLDFKDSVMSTASIFFHETTRTIRNISLTVCFIKNFCVFFFNFNLDA